MKIVFNDPSIKVVQLPPDKKPSGSRFKAGDTVWLKDVPMEDNKPMKVRFADKDGVTVFWLNDVRDAIDYTMVDEMLTLEAPVKPKRPRKPKPIEIVFTPEAKE